MPVFKIGDKVTCTGNRDISHGFPKGFITEILDSDSLFYQDYVTVLNKQGREVTLRAHRFTLVE